MNLDRPRIGIAADTTKRPEMMVERAVLLHQDDDVLNIANRSGAVVCLDGRRLGYVRCERTRREGGHARQLQEFTAFHLAHDVSFFRFARFGESSCASTPHRAQPTELGEEYRGPTLPADDVAMN